MMNSPNINMPESAASPITEAENQHDEGKPWNNKSMVDKPLCSTVSAVNVPKMEILSSSASPPHMQKSYLRHNGMPTRKKLKLEEEEYESLEMACNIASEMNDDCDTFGKHVAAQLRLMTKMQKFMAQRLISEICFRGQIQHLSLSTNVINSPQQHQHQQSQQPQQQQTPQSHLQAAVYAAARPPHMPTTMFGRTPDYLLLHQQGLRPPNAVPSFQNVNTLQPDHLESYIQSDR